MSSAIATIKFGCAICYFLMQTLTVEHGSALVNTRSAGIYDLCLGLLDVARLPSATTLGHDRFNPNLLDA